MWDVISLVLPVTAALTTAAADGTPALVVHLEKLLAAGVVCALLNRALGRGRGAREAEAADPKRVPAVTVVRGLLMLTTTVAILAVDFPTVFQRRFAKTDAWGVSPMDAGVGLFVIAQGLVASSRGNKGLAAVWPAALLGLARVASVAISGYHSVESECVPQCGPALPFLSCMLLLTPVLFSISLSSLYCYPSDSCCCRVRISPLLPSRTLTYPSLSLSQYGAHGNFFFVSAAIGLVNLTSPAVAVAMLAVYEAALSQYGLADFVQNAPRTNMLLANRELVCIVGHVALYALGTALGRWLRERRGKSEWSTAAQLAAAGALLWKVNGLLGGAEGTSRRLANPAYVAFVLSQLCLALAASTALRGVSGRVGRARRGLVHGLNYSPLALFLGANLITGAVNLTVNTMAVPAAQAVMALWAYGAVVACLAYALAFKDLVLHYDLRIKYESFTAYRDEDVLGNN